MNSTRLANALNKIAEGFADLALAIETPGQRTSGQPSSGQSAGSALGTSSVPPGVPPSLPAPSFDDLPPEGWVEPTPLSERDARPVLSDQSLGYCPEHHVPWVVKAGGVSKNGKPYKSFFKCPAKNGDAFCDQKPIPAWSKAHQRDLDAVA